MKKQLYILLFFLMLSIVSGCGEKAPETVEEKKELLAEKEKSAEEIQVEIDKLRKEISEEDTAFALKNMRFTMVTAQPVKQIDFKHFVEITGTVESDRNVMITPEMGGRITKVYVTEGQRVKAGQQLIKVDDVIMRTQLSQLQTNLSLATTLFEKQQSLREQNVGTEVQFLQAKNNKENIERQIATLRSQIGKSSITAPFSGTVQNVMVNEGEMAAPGMPALQLVGMGSETHIEADISEQYLGKVNEGDTVLVQFPSLGDTTIQAKVDYVSDVINPANRTFKIEIRLSPKQTKGMTLRPKMLATLKIQDYTVPQALVVPMDLVQRDEGIYYIYVAEKKGDNYVARRRTIKRGSTYGNKAVVKEGLQPGDMLIYEGFREVSDGGPVKITEPVAGM